MADVEIREVRKSFGATEILHGVNITIPDQSFTVLVGPSGCGKSTLLRMIAGLEKVTSGEIIIDRAVVNRVPPKQRDVAMVFQNYALYPHMKVYDNMAFSLKLANVAPSKIEEAVRKAAAILDLAAYLDRYPRQLSGGQRQRVAMGRAIVRNPRVFLFDEPLSNLDAKLRVQMRTEIRALHQRLKSTTIYVTHDQVEAMTMADQIVVMNRGVIEQIGAPLELYDHPANAFVAGFIGSPAMNFLPGVVRRSARPCVEMDHGTRLPIAPDTPVGDGRAVMYGVRPEHLQYGPTSQHEGNGQGNDEGSGEITADVVVVEPMGSETHIVARLRQENREITAAFRERHPLRPGDTVQLRPDPAQVHVFDRDSGDVIAIPPHL